MTEDSIITALAITFLAGDIEPTAIAARAILALGHPWRWIGPLSRRYAERFEGTTRPRLRTIVEFLANDIGLARAISRHGQRLTVEQWVVPPPEMRPVDAAVEWSLPVLESPLQLAEWLNLPLNQLEWFADLKHYLRRPRVAQQLRHYNYRILDKGWGSIRLIEAPKDRLKEIQRKILAGILDLIPTHDAVHGFRKGRSIRSFVSPHTAQRVVLKMDLSDFFPSIRRARVQALFRTAGYPEAVADLLGGLCTTTTPREIWKSSGVRDPNRLSDARMIYGTPHLPQGAPTSPAIANLCAYRLDCRLAGLARSAAALYTRYADDLAFSGGDDFERRVERFSLHAAAIVQESGFEVHHRKTRIMRQGVRQQVAGLVTNTHPNIRRSDFDELKAILTNCVRLGPSTQNRDLHANFRAHLEGRVSFIESITPPRGSKLRSIFDRIDWTA